MSRIWFTSDTHFGHGNIIKYCNRPFLAEADQQALEQQNGVWHRGDWKGPGSSNWRMSREAIEMMDNTLIDAINANVGTEDTLWHLGDFAFAPRHEYRRRCREYRDRINCNHVNIVIGNHDGDEMRKVFSVCRDVAEITVGNQLFVLCHYAMAVFNRSHRRSIHLYGHSHGGAERWMDAHMPNRRSMDVGVDNIARLFGEYRPISSDEIISLLGARTGHFMDHHANPDAPTEEQVIESQNS